MDINNILNNAIINNTKYQKQNRKNKYTKTIYFKIIEEFISTKKLVSYGGTAINMYLPKEHKFYNEDDIPDYDCFSNNALKDSVELSKILKKNNIGNIEVKSAMFKGTYKIFINFIPIVDITQIKTDIFLNIYNKAVKINNILYAPPSYLKISLYQELSRPLGDLSRWTKIYKRLELLNKFQPLYISNCLISENDTPETDEYKNINNTIIELIEKNNWVVLGDYGLSYYIKYFPKKYQKMNRTIHVPYILTENINTVLDILPFKYSVEKYSYEIVNDFYQIIYNNYPVLYIFITDSCVSYNKINGINVATIDTILSIYYALSFLNIKFFNINKILSYCYLLHNVKTNKGACKRFNLPCVGYQKTIEDMRHERTIKYKLYKKTKSKKIYNEYFFQYIPKYKTIKKIK
jgi:hypothetical protein